MDATTTVSVHADYGEFAPRWRLVFSATYWGSHFDDAAVRRLADSLTAALQPADPDGAGDAG